MHEEEWIMKILLLIYAISALITLLGFDRMAKIVIDSALEDGEEKLVAQIEARYSALQAIFVLTPLLNTFNAIRTIISFVFPYKDK